MNKLLDVFNNLYDQKLKIKINSDQIPEPEPKESDFNSIEEYLTYLENQYTNDKIPSNPIWYKSMISLENDILSIGSTISKLQKFKHDMQPEIFNHVMNLAKKDLKEHLQSPS